MFRFFEGMLIIIVLSLIFPRLLKFMACLVVIVIFFYTFFPNGLPVHIITVAV